MKSQTHLLYLCIVSIYHIDLLLFLNLNIILVAMLSGARNCRDSILSEKLYNRMKSLFPDRRENLISASILLCNTYSSLGEYEQAKHIRSNRIKQLGTKVKVGLSWTEVNGEIVVKKIFLYYIEIRKKNVHFLAIQSSRSFSPSII